MPGTVGTLVGSNGSISPNGPFVVYTTHTIDDISGNNNGLIDYDELIDLNVSFQNVGNVNTQNLNVRMIINNPYVTLIDSIVSISTLNTSQISFTNSPFGSLILILYLL